MTQDDPFGETIYSYSRRQAIEDGVLVDLSEVNSVKQHWKHPFACTSMVWALIESALEKPDQDLSGICHDIATMAKLAVREDNADQIRFRVIIATRTCELKLHIGPGDTQAPVLTLMLPHED